MHTLTKWPNKCELGNLTVTIRFKVSLQVKATCSSICFDELAIFATMNLSGKFVQFHV